MSKLDFEQDNLYQKVKCYICKKIFDETYREGDLIPPERKLSEELGVSRVTIRKALKLLEEERIIERTQGSGTRISLHYGPRQGNMEIITLVAQAQNEFFSKFIDAFQTKANELDSLVLYKQKPNDVSLEKCLFQIYEKGIRNIVLWLEDMQLEERTLQKLRGLGMSIVLFDTVDGGQYVDAVCLDNYNAVERLHRHLKKKGCKKIGYIGWDEINIGGLGVREEVFRQLEQKGKVVHISYHYHNRLQELTDKTIRETLDFMADCDSVIYAVGELGIVFERYAKAIGIHHVAGMVGAMPGGEELGIYMVAQDFPHMAEQIFKCLLKQNQADSGWKAATYKIKGLE